MTKAIVFDLGGVLFTDGSTKFKKFLSRKFKIQYDHISEVISSSIGSDYRSGKITRDEFWTKTLKLLGINEDADRLEEEWFNGYQLIHETKDLIFDLKRKYKVYFLSDNVKERVERLNSLHNFIEWFEGGIFSHETGTRKPDPLIYQMLIKKTGVNPDEMIFIDDNPKNLIPAQAIGTKTFLFENPKKLREELADYLRDDF